MLNTYRIKLDNFPSTAAMLAAAELEGSLGRDPDDGKGVILTQNRYSTQHVRNTLERFGLRKA